MLCKELLERSQEYKDEILKFTHMDTNITVDETEIVTRFTTVLDELMKYCRISSMRNEFNPDVAQGILTREYEKVVAIAMRDMNITNEQNALINRVRKYLAGLDNLILGEIVA